jgi:hypothetical protein
MPTVIEKEESKIKDEKKGLSYKGNGEEMVVAIDVKAKGRRKACKWCYSIDHLTRGSKKCKYHQSKGWTEETARKDVLCKTGAIV